MPGFAKHFKQQLKAAMDQTSGLTQVEREAVVKGYEEALDNERPPRLVLIGEAGVGKSTTINALFNAGQQVGHTKATTDRAYAIPVRELKGSRGTLEAVDMPGLGDDVANYQSYRDLYMRVLPTADAILWVHPSEDRMVHLIQVVLHDLFVVQHPALLSRLVFGLNKADEMHPRDWNMRANLPSAAQLAALGEREKDFTQKVTRVVPAWRGEAVSYSALRRFNLPALFKAMMYAVPEERRWVLEDRMALADFEALVDRKLLYAAKARTLAEVSRHPAEQPGAGDGPTPPTPGTADAPVAEDQSHGGESTSQRALNALSDAEWRALSADRSRFMKFLSHVEGRDAE